jgi:hypothetical protein
MATTVNTRSKAIRNAKVFENINEAPVEILQTGDVVTISKISADGKIGQLDNGKFIMMADFVADTSSTNVYVPSIAPSKNKMSGAQLTSKTLKPTQNAGDINNTDEFSVPETTPVDQTNTETTPDVSTSDIAPVVPESGISKSIIITAVAIVVVLGIGVYAYLKFAKIIK